MKVILFLTFLINSLVLLLLSSCSEMASYTRQGHSLSESNENRIVIMFKNLNQNMNASLVLDVSTLDVNKKVVNTKTYTFDKIYQSYINDGVGIYVHKDKFYNYAATVSEGADVLYTEKFKGAKNDQSGSLDKIIIDLVEIQNAAQVVNVAPAFIGLALGATQTLADGFIVPVTLTVVDKENNEIDCGWSVSDNNFDSFIPDPQNSCIGEFRRTEPGESILCGEVIENLSTGKSFSAVYCSKISVGILANISANFVEIPDLVKYAIIPNKASYALGETIAIVPVINNNGTLICDPNVVYEGTLKLYDPLTNLFQTFNTKETACSINYTVTNNSKVTYYELSLTYINTFNLFDQIKIPISVTK